MLFDYLSHAAGQAQPSFQRSRCLRMRHQNNRCDLCQGACPQGALDFSKDDPLDQHKCTSCFKCTAACPTEALSDTEFSFELLFRQMSSEQAPVIGCALSRAAMKPTIPCIGLLSEAHLAILALANPDGIGIDTTACGQCKNGPMVEALQDRLKDFPAELADRVRIDSYPDCELPKTDRREFFSSLRTGFAREVVTAVAGKEKPASIAYSERQTPRTRNLLNKLLQTVSGEHRAWLQEAFYFALEVNSDCTLCKSCSAFCPSGTLKRKKTEGWTLQFNSAGCSGCGLCVDVCRHSAIRVQSATSETDLFAWQILYSEVQPDSQPEISGNLEKTGSAGREQKGMNEEEELEITADADPVRLAQPDLKV